MDTVETVVSRAKDYDDLIDQMMKFHDARKDKATGSTEVAIFVHRFEEAEKIKKEILPKIEHLPFSIEILSGHKGQWQVMLTCFGGYDLKVYKKTDENILTANTFNIIDL